MGVDDLQANEAEYLTADEDSLTAVIVAAGKGFAEEMKPLIDDRPKSLLDVKGKTILQRQIEALRGSGIRQVAVVRGYQKDSFEPLPDVAYFDNDRHAETNTAASLFCADSAMKGRVLMLYGDILFDDSILQKLCRSDADITLVVDHADDNTHTNGNGSKPVSRPEMVRTSRRLAEAARFIPDTQMNKVLKIGRDLGPEQANAEFIGMALFSDRGMNTLRDVYNDSREKYADGEFHEAENFDRASFADLIQELIDRGLDIACVDIYKGWVEVDTFDDYKRMWAEIEA